MTVRLVKYKAPRDQLWLGFEGAVVGWDLQAWTRYSAEAMRMDPRLLLVRVFVHGQLVIELDRAGAAGIRSAFDLAPRPDSLANRN